MFGHHAVRAVDRWFRGCDCSFRVGARTLVSIGQDSCDDVLRVYGIHTGNYIRLVSVPSSFWNVKPVELGTIESSDTTL